MNYKEKRILKTGYELTQAEINALPKEEKKAREKAMLDSREEIRRLESLDEELL